MAKKDPNKFEVKGNPSIWVTILRHGRDGDHEKEALWHYVFYRNGKRHRGSTGKSEHADAIQAAREAAEKAMGALPSTTAGLTVAQAVEAYKSQRWPVEADRKGNRTYQDAKSRLGFFEGFAGKDGSLSTLDAREAKKLTQRFLDDRAANGSGGQNLLNFRLVLSRFFAWLIGEDHVRWDFNPASHDRLKLPGVEREAPTHLSDDEISTLLKFSRGKAIFPVVVLCLGCGLRPREATRVTWADIDFNQETVKAFGKMRGRRPRMPAWVVTELKAIQTASQPTETASPLFAHNHFTTFDMFAEVRKAARLGEHVSLQALRSTAAARAHVHMNPNEYAAYFGHSLAVAQQHYIGYGAKDDGARVSVAGLEFGGLTGLQPHKKPHKRKPKVVQTKTA